MKFLQLFSVALFLACCSNVVAQSVVVTPQKIIYKRAGKEVPDFKRTFEVRYPIFSGKLSSTVLKNLKRETNYWSVFEYGSLADSIRNDGWLSSFDYEVKYNKNNLLSIWLIMEGVGAYPDSSTEYLVFDLRSGKKLHFDDLFSSSHIIPLRNELRVKMAQIEAGLDREEKEQLDANRKTGQEIDVRSPTPDTFELSDLDGFSLSYRGMTFHYDYAYPHVSKALEPPGEFFLTWKELKPFIPNGGLLAAFTR